MPDNNPKQQSLSYAVKPVDSFNCTVTIPGSKSLTNRALLIAALAQGKSELTGVLFADDTWQMIKALQMLGFSLDIDEPGCKVIVYGQGEKKEGQIVRAKKTSLHLGNAGTAMRSLTALCALGEGEYELDGIARMRQRPIGALVDNLLKLGADITYMGKEGFPPLRILGNGLSGGELDMKPSQSSQFISALMMIAPLMEKGITLNFNKPIISLPYVKMTAIIMQEFGATVETDSSWQKIAIKPANKDSKIGEYTGRNFYIEPDASNASYFLAAAAIVPDSCCKIEGLGANSVQGDALFASVLEKMGAKISIDTDSITVWAPKEGKHLQGVDIDLNDMPDMAQTLAVAALFAKGATTIRNVGNLKVKETDRLAALKNELTKFGAVVDISNDTIVVAPPQKIKPASIDTYDDHRMAMSMAIVGLAAKGIVIENPECVNKTFPKFFQVLENISNNV